MFETISENSNIFGNWVLSTANDRYWLVIGFNTLPIDLALGLILTQYIHTYVYIKSLMMSAGMHYDAKKNTFFWCWASAHSIEFSNPYFEYCAVEFLCNKYNCAFGVKPNATLFCLIDSILRVVHSCICWFDFLLPPEGDIFHHHWIYFVPILAFVLRIYARIVLEESSCFNCGGNKNSPYSKIDWIDMDWLVDSRLKIFLVSCVVSCFFSTKKYSALKVNHEFSCCSTYKASIARIELRLITCHDIADFFRCLTIEISKTLKAQNETGCFLSIDQQIWNSVTCI